MRRPCLHRGISEKRPLAILHPVVQTQHLLRRKDLLVVNQLLYFFLQVISADEFLFGNRNLVLEVEAIAVPFVCLLIFGFVSLRPRVADFEALDAPSDCFFLLNQLVAIRADVSWAEVARLFGVLSRLLKALSVILLVARVYLALDTL